MFKSDLAFWPIVNMSPFPEMAKHRLAMFAAAALMATVSLFLFFMPVSVFGVVAFRGIFGVAWMTIVMFSSKRAFAIKAIMRHPKSLAVLVATSVLAIFFYFITIKLSGPAIGAFLLYVGNIVAVAFIRLFLKEPVPKITWLSYALAIGGIICIMEPWTADWLSAGLLTGILSAVSLGTLNLSKKVMFRDQLLLPPEQRIERASVSLAMSWWTTLGLAATFSFTFFTETQAMLAKQSIIVGLLLGLLPTAIAFTLFNQALQHDKGGNVLIISYVEPLGAALIDIFFFGNFSPLVLLGGGLIILANILVLRVKARKGKVPARGIKKETP